ncbi:hypothetical protein M3Y97_01075500 [Aphelenchoides bicaudatus]|nr:hypothetical protein M3Y97_01075500 [Aphelenchoides bicaudatus]
MLMDILTSSLWITAPNIINVAMSGSLEWLVRFHHAFLYVAEGIAVSSNTILVYLIITERKKLYSDYRRDLLLACVVDYICSFIGIVLQPHFEILDGQWVAILESPLIHFPRIWQIVAVGILLHVKLFWPNNDSNTLFIPETSNLQELFYMTTVCFLSSSVTVFMFSYSFFVSQGHFIPKQELVNAGIIRQNGVLLNAEMSSVPMISLITTISIMTSTIFASVVYLSFKTYKKLNTMYCDMGPKTIQMQCSFNRMLTTQISATFVFGVIPAVFLIFLMITRINVVGAGTVISILFACVPVINPLCTLFLVGQFRQRFLSFLFVTNSISASVEPALSSQKHITTVL